jgi:hypothetical protein
MKKLDHDIFMNTMTDREEEELVKDPVRFWVWMQNRYVHKDPDFSQTCKEIADEHRRIERTDTYFRELIPNLAKKKRENLEKDGTAKLSIWD